jgi:hypothetical protein
MLRFLESDGVVGWLLRPPIEDCVFEEPRLHGEGALERVVPNLYYSICR